MTRTAPRDAEGPCTRPSNFNAGPPRHVLHLQCSNLGADFVNFFTFFAILPVSAAPGPRGPPQGPKFTPPGQKNGSRMGAENSEIPGKLQKKLKILEGEGAHGGPWPLLDGEG